MVLNFAKASSSFCLRSWGMASSAAFSAAFISCLAWSSSGEMAFRLSLSFWTAGLSGASFWRLSSSTKASARLRTSARRGC
ncbi:hypothetical protein VFPPC_18509 [Pochonia chlamydosporia 170]|uniref:Uncharacterized protein n=1 Tax=Pochonia chlamydosporia 170 TaxID=1380566 RepID=A0A219ANN6_METCM|nr:hypothetical protein VFPPC_18509 [Pochonia chlamydosporia 170]OWT42460.1 hypothetical protein VFPPC_18509 [Pochonia chlamydosporia 170]